MHSPLTAESVIHLLDLKPLEIEGGYFRETYRASQQLPESVLPSGYRGPRSFATAIYYLLTPDTFSRMHRVPGEEIFHFYLGDAVEMLQIAPDGSGAVIIMGHDLAAGMAPQHIVPAGYWQGAWLRSGGRFALLGTTMSPGFEYENYESGRRDELLRQFPNFSDMIRSLTPA